MKKLSLFLSLMLWLTALAAQNQNQDLIFRLRAYSPKSVRATVENLNRTFGASYGAAKEAENVVAELTQKKDDLIKRLKNNDEAAKSECVQLLKKIDALMLENPLVKGKKILALRRTMGDRARWAMGSEIGVGPSNFQNNSEFKDPTKIWTNEFVILKANGGNVSSTPLYKPLPGMMLNDPEPHFDGNRVLFSSIGTSNRWHLFELDCTTGKTKQVTPDAYKDFDSFDGCYTPDNRIIFCSTGTFLGLPCTNGGHKMCGLFQYDPKTGKTRQLTYDQDSNWGPVVMNNGQILYQRWEYADLAHSNSRIMFTMNPDGTSQQAYYGSNSYFPTAYFNARPIPGHPSAMIGTVSGHHSIAHSGRLMVIDPMKGREEADGVVCEIPYSGKKVEPIVRDRLPDGVWPHFLQPFPLNDTYTIVAVKPTQNSLWGLYLVDTNDNMTLISEEEGVALIEPALLEPRTTPAVIPDRIKPGSKTATVFLQDVYMGNGLKGIPRGKVKKLRIGSYDFSPLSLGGLIGTIGMDGPWDVKRVLGTVDVEADGSAMFTVPANTPIFVQPLDEEGKALQLMRSWFTAMPGEMVSCIGCHESKNTIPIPKSSLASKKKPQSISEWYGKARGFSYRHEVQPVLDAYCVSCHDGSKSDRPYLKGDKYITDWSSRQSGSANPEYGGHFTVSYTNLHRYVRRPGIESDLHMLTPMEFHADQTELMQMLIKGHHNVVLDKKSIEKIACWIDMNAPFHGRRSDIPTYEKALRSKQLRDLYVDMFGAPKTDNEWLPEIEKVKPVAPATTRPEAGETTLTGWPMQMKDVQQSQMNLGDYQKTIDLGNGIRLTMIKIPAGSFIMGSDRQTDEMPQAKVEVKKSYWIGQLEISNAQYRMFDPQHDSRDEDRHGYQFGRKCYFTNHPDQPAVRISWQEAMEYCKWLTKKTGFSFTLPTEAQWEWACRAGSNSPFWFGQLNSNFSRYANLGDIRLRDYAANTTVKSYETTGLIHNPNKYDDWVPRDTVYDDGGFIAEQGGRYIQNPWDLMDMHGNVAEWTLSTYKPYPYNDEDGRNNPLLKEAKRVARGGSWYDRPFRATASFRTPYRDYQKVYNVGFRVVMTEEE